MNILIVSGGFPSLIKAKEAAHIVTYSISKELVSKNHNLDLQIINYENYFDVGSEIPVDSKELYGRVLKPLLIKKKSRIQRLLEFISSKKEINRNLTENYYFYKNYDLIIPIWHELGTRVMSYLPNKKILYYGNLEFLVKKSNIILDFKIHKDLRNFLKLIFFYLTYPLEIRNSIFYLRKYDHIFNVSYLDSQNLIKYKLPSSYLQMTWDYKEELQSKNKIVTDKIKNHNYRVCCSVGRLSNTGNTYAFITLLSEIMPEIKKRDLNDLFQLQIYGGGDFKYNFLRKKLISNGIEIMGFVDDLESELESTYFSIIPHNRFGHRVSHTRVLHNWNIGLPLILFKESAGPMPELIHGYNCLLAKNPIEFVSFMLLLVEDENLKNSLRKNGRLTLKKNFSTEKVTNEIIKKYELIN